MLAGTATATTVSGCLLAGAGHIDRPALVAGDSTLTFRELRERVDAAREGFELPHRSLVTLAGDQSVDFVVTYLALLEAGHVPILAGDHSARLAGDWQVGARVTATADSVVVASTGAQPIELHPDLALLVSTSGSTGSPKLVRLSHDNLTSNALAIADVQQLTEADRGITSLPLHYCFGLSVLHSHLAVGASVVLTNNSVVDRCFRKALRDHGATNMAGVPHTYELLGRSNPDEIGGPPLRLLTQAGGRMAPETVAAWADRAEAWGAEFMVMYGQSEATARIACLPPALAGRRPGAVGRPIPGGSIELRPVEGHGPDVGEIVYRGPNVMMGYATEHGDLALGRTLDELSTGDLARHHPVDDVYEIVGRKSRFVKPFGLRIDLDEVQSRLASHAPGELVVAGDDEQLVAYAPGADEPTLMTELAAATTLPPRCLRVLDRPIPRTASGKVDHATMLADAANDEPERLDNLSASDQGESVATIYASALGLSGVGPDDTFVSLGGDSLSYVECSIRLEAALGRLPEDWHLQPVSALAGAVAPRRRFARLDTTVVLRALAICLVVSTHMRVRHLPGGAHTLLAVAGFNLARFMTPIESPIERVRAGVRTAARAAVPAMVWVGVGALLFGAYSLGTLFLVNNYVGPSSHADDHWHFWFIEVFVHLVLLATLLSAVPALRRADRRFAFLAPLVVLGVALVARTAYMDDWYNLRFRTHGVAFFFVLGWLIQRSTTWPQRLFTSGVAIASVLGYFHIAAREWRIVALLLLLVWVREIPVPRWSVRLIGTVAAASMWIYVSHFSIWPLFRSVFIREVAYVFTLAAGIAVWFAADRLVGLLSTWRRAAVRRLAASRRAATAHTGPHHTARPILRGTPRPVAPERSADSVRSRWPAGSS